MRVGRGLGERDAAVGPRRLDDRGHVGCVSREEVVAARTRALVRGDEERERRIRVAAGADRATALQVDAQSRDVARGKALCLDEQPLGCGERTAKPLGPRELRQHLRPPVVVGLARKLVAQPRFGSVEVVEIEERA